MTTAPARAASLDVLLLLDDTRALEQYPEGAETFLFVSEVVEALEPALERLGHRSRRLSFAVGVPEVVGRLACDPPDVVFHLGQPVPTDPACEAQVTALLELLGRPHTSESPETLVLARDKVRAKALLAAHAIETPGYAVSLHGELPDALPRAPWIAKPALEDGSLGIGGRAPTRARAQLGEQIRALHERFDEPILVETFVGGREFQIGIVGTELLPIVEVDLGGLPVGRPRVLGYEAKWNYDSTEHHALRQVCPAPISDALAERLASVARRTCVAFGVQRCTRLDVRMDEHDGLHVLDVNPNPDLSPMGSMPLMADVAGWGFDGLVQRLLDLAQRGRTKGP